MIRSALLVIAACATVLGGCAATVQGTGERSAIPVPARATERIGYQIAGTPAMGKESDFARMRDELDRAMKARIGAAGRTVGAADKPGVRLKLTVADYRYVSAGARYGLGVMTGNAFLKGTIEAFDATTDRKLGERDFNTSSSAWQGVFSAMTPAQCDAVANEALALVGVR